MTYKGQIAPVEKGQTHMAKLPDFDGLAFPVITVRLANHKGRASIERGDATIRATLNYTYDQPDGERFAVKVARKLWDQVAADESAGGGLPAETVVLVPGNAGRDKGYMFTAVPVRFFQ